MLDLPRTDGDTASIDLDFGANVPDQVEHRTDVSHLRNPV
jgi:hypothetical protein